MPAAEVPEPAPPRESKRVEGLVWRRAQEAFPIELCHVYRWRRLQVNHVVLVPGSQHEGNLPKAACCDNLPCLEEVRLTSLLVAHLDALFGGPDQLLQSLALFA